MTESVLTQTDQKASADGAAAGSADTSKTVDAGKTADTKAGDSAAKGDAKTATVVPEKYTLKAPEGFDATKLADVEKTAKELGLSNEAAQKLLERDAAQAKGFQDSAKAQLAELSTKWVDAIKADKEIGGESFKGSVEAAHRALEKFGSDALRQALNETGLGNHPELVRTFARIGKAMSEDKFHSGEQGKQKPRDAATLLYGSK